jgi:hypothetical protein
MLACNRKNYRVGKEGCGNKVTIGSAIRNKLALALFTSAFFCALLSSSGQSEGWTARILSCLRSATILDQYTMRRSVRASGMILCHRLAGFGLKQPT